MKEISINGFEGIKIGEAGDAEGGTGCTVILCEDGAAAGLDVRGGGPASRESELLKPLAAADRIHAVVLAGGSAYGLAAADGVMQYLEERGKGFDVGPAKVPLVCQSSLFDLTAGNPGVRPDKAMGYRACMASVPGNYRDGNSGAGTGATVGKLCGMERCMKSGTGSYAVQTGDLKIGAVVAVNALGDIFDHRTGRKLAGMLTEDRRSFASSKEEMYRSYKVVENKFTGNTTIGVLITNASFGKSQLCRIASMGHNGYARSISPVHTTADGDSIYCISAGDVEADIDVTGTLAADVMAEAVKRAVLAAESAYGFPCASDML